jgi:hypothetical protein
MAPQHLSHRLIPDPCEDFSAPEVAAVPTARKGRRAVRLCLATGVLILSLAYGCSRKPGTSGEADRPIQFEEHTKTGAVSLVIVGDYFDHRYVLELARLAKTLSPESRQICYCSPQYQKALGPLFASNDIKNVETPTLDPSSVISAQWARDIFVAGTDGKKKTIIASPYKYAQSEKESRAIGDFLRPALPDYSVTVAPFVFEGGNLAFVSSGGKRFLIVGRKVIFDNEAYQKRPWAAGYDETSLRQAIAKTFGVDSVIVVGRARQRPAGHMYFEYHIDMGMVVLKDDNAVVSQLEFGARERAVLAHVVRATHPVLTPFTGVDRDSLYIQLSHRLDTIAQEYDDYAAVLDRLGLHVHRSPVDWPHVVGSMSWTNVLQAGDRILMPLYPDSLMGVTKAVDNVNGQLRIALDVSDVHKEEFKMQNLNLANAQLYESLGYEVVGVPEYLHYMMGGLHCLVNIVE